MFNVTDVPAPPDVVSAVNATLATAVEFIMLNMHSFTSSTASPSSVVPVQLLTMPVGQSDPSPTVPSARFAAVSIGALHLKLPEPSVVKNWPSIPPVMLTLALLPKDITPVLALRVLPSTIIFAIFTLPLLSNA